MRSLFFAAVATAALATPLAAQPKGLDASCTAVYQRYAAATGPKAFAAGKSGRCGWQRQTTEFSTMVAIRAQAVRQCASSGGDGCRVVDQSN